MEVRVPDIGDFDAVEVIEVLVEVGQTVAVDDSLITLESDKASMEVPAPAAGTVQRVAVKLGDVVSEGALILELSEAAAAPRVGGDKSAVPAQESAASPPRERAAAKEEEPVASPAPNEQAPPKPPTTSATQGGARVPPVAGEPERGSVPHASPGVRRFARELGVDLARVEGSGAKGRILKEDVQGFVKQSLAGERAGTAGPVGAGIPPIPAVDFSKFGPVEEVTLSRIRKLSAASLHRSWLNVPHVTQFDEADITELEVFRKAMKAEAEQRGVKLTPLAFLLKAAAASLVEFPDFNSSMHPDGDRLLRKGYYHLGVAVDTPQGLVVPVIRDVDQKGVFELAGELGEVSGRARDGKLRPADIQGATFTISSLGGIGGTGFTPIVNAPEVAILGVARSKMQPVFADGTFVPRLILPFSVSYDHRVVDGAEAVRFTTHLAATLSDIRRLVL